MDCLRPVRIDDGTPEGPDFDIDGDALTTESESALLVYVARVDDPGLWPPAFVHALCWALASELSPALNNDVKRQQLCQQTALAAMRAAVNADIGARRPPKTQGAWMRSRRG